MHTALAENKAELSDLKFSDNVPYKYYPIYCNNELKEKKDFCVLSADPQCKAGILAYVDIPMLLNPTVNYEVDPDNIFALIQKYVQTDKPKGFYSWSTMDREDARAVRGFIGDAQVVTGFNYDGSLPDAFEEYRIKPLNKKTFSCQDWLETLLEKPMTLTQAMEFLSFEVELEPEQKSMRQVPDEEKSVLRDHKDNLFLSMYLAIFAYITVNQ